MRINDFPLERIRLICEPCQREGSYSKRRLAEIVAPITNLPDARLKIAELAGCPKVTALGLDRCKIHFPDLYDLTKNAEGGHPEQ